VVSIKLTTHVHQPEKHRSRYRTSRLALCHDRRRSFAFADAANHPHRDESRKQCNEKLFHVNPLFERRGKN
jgi:hypothetical protein